ncbi:MFS transporter [Paeniglutamicibacter antarcticus]|uniref:MFS transporter n=2 Tax=Arthrobacter terrae TaxID=2935737 RepID=A0A931G4L5_9MICC|nr:MFS transporter [Arthrobacter terrae]
MVVLITVINYVDRGAISYAANPMIKEFGLDKAQWGEVLGYFGYGYMVGALFGGALADRKGPRWVWTWAVLLWSVFEIGMAFAGNIGVALFGGSALVGFAVFRILFGVSEGPTFSTINRTMANWATVKERGFAASLGLLGTPLGALLAAPIAVFLLTVTGQWRWMFIILGLLGLVWLIFWRRVFTNLPEENPKVSPEELSVIRSTEGMLADERSLSTEEERLPWWSFFQSRTLVFNAIGYFAFQYVNFMILTWTPKYLQDEFGFNLGSLWYLGMVPWIGACFTVLLGGKISDWLRRRTGSLWIARSGFAAGSLLLTTVCFCLIPTVHSAGAVLLLMAIGNALNSLPNAVYWIVVIDTAPTRAGTFGGISHFITNIATIVAPTLTGFLVALHGYNSMFIATGVATAVGMLAMVFVRPGVRRGKKLTTGAAV